MPRSKRPQNDRPVGLEPKDPISRANPAAEWLPIDSLQGWDRNPRRHGETVPKLMRAIIRYGWGSPIEARSENREIIAGHGRMQAAQRLASKWAKTSETRRARWHTEARRVAETGQVPVRLRDLDEDEAHQAAIADNRIGQESSWNKDELADLLAEFEDDIDLMGFSDSELDGQEPRAQRTVEVSELDPTFTITVTGPLARQADVLTELRDRLESIPGVEFDCFVEEALG